MGESTSAIGFHGTSGENAQKILAEGFRPSSNAYDWLGDGVYFFQDAPQRAWDWARRLHKGDPAVIGAVIRLENCFDLLDLPWTNLMTQMYDSVLSRYKSLGKELPKQSEGAHRIDRLVINYAANVLAERGYSIQCVRGAFIEGEPIFPNSLSSKLAHIQIAVRDTIILEKVWLEPDGGPYVLKS